MREADKAGHHYETLDQWLDEIISDGGHYVAQHLAHDAERLYGHPEKSGPKGDIQAAGNLQFEEGESYPRSILVTFDTEEDCRKAIMAGGCEYTFMEKEAVNE